MWTDGNGFFYLGDMQPGHRAATPDEQRDLNIKR